jgi:hypothetical protein
MGMLTMSRRALIAAAVSAVFALGAASAQQPGRIRAEIEKADGGMLTLKTREGATIKAKLADGARVTALVKATLADIKPDSWIGIAGIPKSDGSIEAFSIHLPPPALRGQGEGERPWDAKPGSTMTNTYFQSGIAGKDGSTLTVKNKDGEKKVIVTSATVIAKAVPADLAELKAGAHIIIFGQETQPDGTVVIKSMYVGRGITPAM